MTAVQQVMSRRRAIAIGAATAASASAMLRDASAAPNVVTPTASDPSRFPVTTQPASQPQELAPGLPGQDYTPVITPNGVSLPWKIIDGVKIFHLIAEPVRHEFAPGLQANCWGYNGRTPGPTIEAVEGDRVRVYVTNRLAAPTTVHWHGVIVPNGMDGVSGMTQLPIKPRETYLYEFTLRNAGTHMYHSHFDDMTQGAMGMMGMFIIHRREPGIRRPDRDFAIMLSEWRIDPGTSRPSTMEMTDFNVLTMNSKAFPGTEALVAKTGDLVRLRFGNLGAMDHHPIHLHGFDFTEVERDGALVPASARVKGNTTLVAVGQTRACDFIADAPGDWAMHCHMTHHTMNQMGHGAPNMIGVRPGKLDDKVQELLPSYMTMGQDGMGEMESMGMPVPKNSIPMAGGRGKYAPIDMGGMFTIVKVRSNIRTYDDPGWYDAPTGTVATNATAEQLRRDGIDTGA